MKYSFYNDYSEGVHPRILEALSESNFVQAPGYGLDSFCLEAEELIREKIGNFEAGVYFVSGGTQANLISLAAMMKPYEAVIAANSGHIAVHEAGAIEATGHKILEVPSLDGKLTVSGISAVVEAHTDEHMVKPRVVFISNSTEVGTVYSRSELEAIREYCFQAGLYLYLDGARLGMGMMGKGGDLTLRDLGRLTDMFYIGGTKNGALFGEAIVINHSVIKEGFRWHMKQRGGLLAKGRALGVQFYEFFKDDLYFDLAKKANEMAWKLADGIEALGYEFMTKPVSNQIFPVFPGKVVERLEKDYGFYRWKGMDGGKVAIRLVTSWATEEGAVEEFLNDLKRVGTVE